MSFFPWPRRKQPDNLGDSVHIEFDSALSAIDKAEVFDWLYKHSHDKYIVPPLDPNLIAKSLDSNPHHASALQVKRNILLSTFIPHKRLSIQGFESFVWDYLIFGNTFLREAKNRAGGIIKYEPLKARWMRVGKKNDYYYLRGHETEKISGNVYHHKTIDITQDIYGRPEYLSAMNSAWLNEAATLFRRKYYINGSHAGYIFHVTEEMSQDDVNNLKRKLRESKGLGNFKNLFMYNPQGKKDGINLIPIAEVQARDEFYNIKTLTRDDVFTIHRVPPQLMGVIPQNTAGFGDVVNASEVFVTNELLPLQARLAYLNEMAGEEIIRFKTYSLADKSNP